MWLPKGAALLSVIRDIWQRFQYADGYEFVGTPHLARASLWEQTNQLSVHEREIFGQIDVGGIPYVVKPSNCPLHIELYRSRNRSYRELPIRMAELATVYRKAPSGTLRGLFSVRSITQDDAHIFCRLAEAEDEVVRAIQLMSRLLGVFGFSQLQFTLGTRGERSLPDDEKWDTATRILQSALRRSGIEYSVETGGATYYAPRLDVSIVDRYGRKWPLPDLQADLQLPDLCNLRYEDATGRLGRPVILHRTIIGSLERFVAALLEHFQGRFPAWLSPVQLLVFPVTEEFASYANEIVGHLRSIGYRAQADPRPHRLAKRIRTAHHQHVPFLGVVGKQEMAQRRIHVTAPQSVDLGQLDISQLVATLDRDAAIPNP